MTAFTVTNTFTSGTPALASEVNQNFTDIETKIDTIIDTSTGKVEDDLVDTDSLADDAVTMAKIDEATVKSTDVEDDNDESFSTPKSVKTYADAQDLTRGLQLGAGWTQPVADTWRPIYRLTEAGVDGGPVQLTSTGVLMPNWDSSDRLDDYTRLDFSSTDIGANVAKITLGCCIANLASNDGGNILALSFTPVTSNIHHPYYYQDNYGNSVIALRGDHAEYGLMICTVDVWTNSSGHCYVWAHGAGNNEEVDMWVQAYEIPA